MNVCVYCSSSERVESRYFDVARQLGALIGERKNNLVFGGGNTGPMNVLARAVKASGGRVVSVIPRIFKDRGLAFAPSDELVVTENLQERRMMMIKGSDAFVALPGGFGTLEEVSENLTMRQLELHQKPLALVDVNGFWTGYVAFIDQLLERRFILPEHRTLLHVVDSPEAALAYLDDYAPVNMPDKWRR
jgi:hypothetical protein